MFSYIYMKILESQPFRYDNGIRWLSLGRSDRIKERIAADHVRAGSRVLDIGAGTGTLAILAAREGARVLGFDVSALMLDVARKKITKQGLDERVDLKEMGVAQMDGIEGGTFDLVTSTLVFSELSPDERAYAIQQSYRVLKPGGVLVIADETRPRRFWKRFLYHLVRIPLLIVTFILTQTTTKAVRGLDRLISGAGFRIRNVDRSAWETFVCVTAQKPET